MRSLAVAALIAGFAEANSAANYVCIKDDLDECYQDYLKYLSIDSGENKDAKHTQDAAFAQAVFNGANHKHAPELFGVGMNIRRRLADWAGAISTYTNGMDNAYGMPDVIQAREPAMMALQKVNFDDPDEQLMDIAHKTAKTVDVHIQNLASKNATFKESEDYKIWNHLQAKNTDMKFEMGMNLASDSKPATLPSVPVKGECDRITKDHDISIIKRCQMKHSLEAAKDFYDSGITEDASANAKRLLQSDCLTNGAVGGGCNDVQSGFVTQYSMKVSDSSCGWDLGDMVASDSNSYMMGMTGMNMRRLQSEGDAEKRPDNSRDKTLVKGHDAFMVYITKIAKYYHPNKTIDTTCIRGMEDVSITLMKKLEAIVNFYNGESKEEIAKAVKVGLAELDNVLISFMKTDCGRSIFSEETIAKVEENEKNLKNANITVKFRANVPPDVFVNGHDMTNWIHLMNMHGAIIYKAQKDGQFHDNHRKSHWDQLAKTQTMTHSHVAYIYYAAVEPEDDSKGMSTTTIVGIVMGGVVMLGLITAAAHYFIRRKDQKASPTKVDGPADDTEQLAEPISQV